MAREYRQPNVGQRRSQAREPPKGSPWVEIRKTSFTNFKSAGKSMATSPAVGSARDNRRPACRSPTSRGRRFEKTGGQRQTNLPAAGVLDAIAHFVIGGAIGGKLRTDLAIPDPGRGDWLSAAVKTRAGSDCGVASVLGSY